MLKKKTIKIKEYTLRIKNSGEKMCEYSKYIEYTHEAHSNKPYFIFQLKK